jgi:hypothetical protein
VEQGYSVLLQIVMQDNKGRRGGAMLHGKLEGNWREGSEQQDATHCLLKAREITAEREEGSQGAAAQRGGSRLSRRRKSGRSSLSFFFLAHTLSLTHYPLSTRY